MEHWRTNQPQAVHLRKIEVGVDVRTTIMLRNFPNPADFEDFKIFLEATSDGHYDFSYLRVEFSCGICFSPYILHVLLVAAQNTNSTEMKQLLPHCADGVKINSSIETAMAGCEEDNDGARSFMINE
ncbi:hypothetical protein KCU81_g7170, partial [Aureobasidium melanogenum]|uniref:Uncharacterized protein n=1 Tax=Aureobasidium melanogenum (strain CBS 110374) TaxID=1043003 RepID=A0A074W7W5_AURM1